MSNSDDIPSMHGKPAMAGGAGRFSKHGGAQLGAGGPYRATTNIGAEKPEEYGLYF